MARSGTLARVGPENVFETFNEALKAASNASEGQG
jgi:hypothetical protein